MALRLRPVRRADLDTLERWWNDPGAGPLQLVRVLGRRAAAAPVRAGRPARRGPRNLLVELDGGTLAGDVSYHAVHHGPNPGSRAFNVGIALVPEHRGRGHGAEAQRQLAAYLFAHTVERLRPAPTWTTWPSSGPWSGPASPARGSCASQARDGGYHDMVLYSRLRDD